MAACGRLLPIAFVSYLSFALKVGKMEPRDPVRGSPLGGLLTVFEQFVFVAQSPEAVRFSALTFSRRR